ncbi:MAG TPA: DUF433 domain-containing protein [Vicinamibacteria bacterium]|nr:DUF433 domain-containing protein [Vicinamibacteria bacterium]
MPRRTQKPTSDELVRELPAYTIADAAHYLGVPPTTLRSWVHGRSYDTSDGIRRFKPIIKAAGSGVASLSFINLVEAYVLDAIRRRHKVRLDKVRVAVAYLEREFGTQHPLAAAKMMTDGCELFIHYLDRLIVVSQDGQLAMKEMLDAYLKRIEWSPDGFARRFYPFVRGEALDQPMLVVVDPTVSFGRPTLRGTGIPTSIIAERHKAGESIAELAANYARETAEIEEAIRCEIRSKAA